MHRTQVYLQDEIYFQLQTKAKQTGLSISELIRQAVERDLKYQPNAAQRFFATHLPLQSFHEENSSEYVKHLRENSRILRRPGDPDD